MKAFLAKIKGLALDKLQSCLDGPVDKAMVRSDESFACWFESRQGRGFFFFPLFFYDDDGGAKRRGAGEHEVQASLCCNDYSDCRR